MNHPATGNMPHMLLPPVADDNELDEEVGAIEPAMLALAGTASA